MASPAGRITAGYFINSTTHELALETKQPFYSITMPVAGKVTASALKKCIGGQIGIAPEHISLKWGKDHVVYSMYMGRETRNSISKGELSDADEVPQTGQVRTRAWDMHDYTETFVRFCVERCADRSHCPDVVTIGGLFGEVAKVPFSPATTVGQLKQAISEKVDFPVRLQRLFIDSEHFLVDDAQTLGELGIRHDSIINVIRLSDGYRAEAGQTT